MRKFGISRIVRVVLAAAGAVALTATVNGQAPGGASGTGAVQGIPPGIRRGELPPGSVFQMLHGGSEIGVSIRDVVREDVAKMKLPAEAGAVIRDVRRGGPADTAGMHPGDVIVEFDGEKVRGTAQLTRLVRETPAGRHIKATVIRDGSRVDLDVVPAETEGLRMPFNADEVRQSIERALPLPRGVLGVTTQELTPELAAYFGTKGGVLVARVVKDSPAEKAGMKTGDVITEVAGKAIRDSRDLVREVQGQQGQTTVKVVRGKKELTLKVTPEPRSPERPQVRGI